MTEGKVYTNDEIYTVLKNALDIDSIRLNALNRRIEITWKHQLPQDMTDGNFAKIMNGAQQCVLQYGPQFGKKDNIINCINFIAEKNQYNPIKLYLERCAKRYQETREPQVEGEVAKLCRAIIPQAESQENIVDVFLKKWIVGCVARVFSHHQNPVLILYGKQNIGKSTFFSKLCSGVSAYFYESDVDVYDKDSHMKLGSKFIWLLDEFGSVLKSRDRNKVKAFITQDKIEVRPAYARYTVTLDRCCSLAGTTNDLDILTDPTGNRRYLILPVERFDFGIINSIDYDMLWGEAMMLAQHPENYMLSDTEKTIQTEQNLASEVINPLQELFKLWFEECPTGFVPYIDVEAKVSKENGFGDVAIGRMRFEISDTMKKIGAKSYKKNNTRGYLGVSWRQGHHPSATLDLREIEAMKRVNPRETH